MGMFNLPWSLSTHTNYVTAHTPKAVLAENFRIAANKFDKIPTSEKYIFKGTNPGSIEDEKPRGFKKSKINFTHHMHAQTPIDTSGGRVRITDSSNFPISKTVSAAHLEIAPGALREMHWHPNADEWTYFKKGRARVTIFAAEGNARTFNYMAGDVGIVPRNMGHYVENLSDDEPLEILEIFRSDAFQDFSLSQWLGRTPPRMIADHLYASDPELAEEFLKKIEGGDKDPIKNTI
jgi:oxalate decarboxylase family bicupin protein